ncbi:MAG: hypothetical protein AAFR98_10920 [Pseudomonadota bacterium]
MRECPSSFASAKAARAFAAAELCEPGAPDYKVIKRGMNGRVELLIFTDDIEIRDAMEALGYTVRNESRIDDYEGW